MVWELGSLAIYLFSTKGVGQSVRWAGKIFVDNIEYFLVAVLLWTALLFLQFLQFLQFLDSLGFFNFLEFLHLAFILSIAPVFAVRASFSAFTTIVAVFPLIRELVSTNPIHCTCIYFVYTWQWPSEAAIIVCRPHRTQATLQACNVLVIVTVDCIVALYECMCASVWAPFIILRHNWV